MNRGLDDMARPYLEELEAMLATDLTATGDFDYNDFDENLLDIERGLDEIPESNIRQKALYLLAKVKQEYQVISAEELLNDMFDEEDLEEMNEW